MPNWSAPSIATFGAQFLTLGPFEQSGDVDFFLSVDEATPIVLTENAAYYPVLTDTPSEQP